MRTWIWLELITSPLDATWYFYSSLIILPYFAQSMDCETLPTPPLPPYLLPTLATIANHVCHRIHSRYLSDFHAVCVLME